MLTGTVRKSYTPCTSNKVRAAHLSRSLKELNKKKKEKGKQKRKTPNTQPTEQAFSQHHAFGTSMAPVETPHAVLRKRVTQDLETVLNCRSR